MARRRIKHVRVGRCSVDIYRDSETHEFVVHSTMYGGRRDSGYFTEDKRDARSTAAQQVRWLRKRMSCKAAV